MSSNMHFRIQRFVRSRRIVSETGEFKHGGTRRPRARLFLRRRDSGGSCGLPRDPSSGSATAVRSSSSSSIVCVECEWECHCATTNARACREKHGKCAWSEENDDCETQYWWWERSEDDYDRDEDNRQTDCCCSKGDDWYEESNPVGAKADRSATKGPRCSECRQHETHAHAHDPLESSRVAATTILSAGVTHPGCYRRCFRCDILNGVSVCYKCACCCRRQQLRKGGGPVVQDCGVHEANSLEGVM